MEDTHQIQLFQEKVYEIMEDLETNDDLTNTIKRLKMAISYIEKNRKSKKN